MKLSIRNTVAIVALFLGFGGPAMAETLETKPNDPYYAKFNLIASPKPTGPVLREGDRLAICGDSITEQRRYSRILETYLTVALPELHIRIRQFGWSGEQASGFLGRMTNDVLRFHPTVATTCYGMNDFHYRPYEESIGQIYTSNMTQVVLDFKNEGARVILGSPGCIGFSRPPWAKTPGTAEDLDLSLARLRNIDIGIAHTEYVGFADVFWPMYQAQFVARQQWGTNYALTGKDSVHPDWAGHLVMAYAFLKALDVPGDIGTFTVNLRSNKAKVSKGHQLVSCANGTLTITSFRYPFCAAGPVDSAGSIRSGMALVPFNQDFNRLTLIVKGAKAENYKVTWGETSRNYTAAQLKHGVNLAEDFPVNPFSKAFSNVDEAVAAKEAYETKQIKELFHGKAGRSDMEKTVLESEQERAPLVEAVHTAFVPVTHTISITPE